MAPTASPALLLLLFTSAEDQEAFDRTIDACAAPLLSALPSVLDYHLARAVTGPRGHPPYEWILSLRFPDRASMNSAIDSAAFSRFETLCRPWSGLLTLIVAEERLE